VPQYVRVFDAGEAEVPSQVIGAGAGFVRVLFTAAVPAAGFTVYEVRPSTFASAIPSTCTITETGLANERYTGTILTFPADITTAREVDGQENDRGAAVFSGNTLTFDLTRFQPRAFRVTLAPPATSLQPAQCEPMALTCTVDGMSSDARRGDGNMDGSGRTIPVEILPDTIRCDGIPFVAGPKADGQLNVLACAGQELPVDGNTFTDLYILAAAGRAVPVTVKRISGRRGEYEYDVRIDNQGKSCRFEVVVHDVVNNSRCDVRPAVQRDTAMK